MELNMGKVLIVAPIAVAKGVWRQEYEKWPEITGLKFSLCVGSTKQRLAGLNANADVYLINYESLGWLFNLPEYKAFEFSAIVFDESTRVQSASSVLFKGKGKRKNPKYKKDNDEPVFLKPIKGIKHRAHEFDYAYIMTGGPKPNEYLSLWSQAYCLDQGRALGKNITTFKNEFYVKYGPEHYHIKIKNKEAETEIQRRLRHILYRIPTSEIAAVLPKVKEITHHAEMPSKAWGFYTELKQDLLIDLELQGTITVNNLAILSGKLQQVCQGAIYNDDRDVIQIHNEKIDLLDSIVSDLGGHNVLVIYQYGHDRERLLKWRKAPILRSTLSDKKFNALQDEWNAGKHPIMYGHPKSMGHGLNLQGGGFHVVFFTTPWSLDFYLQVVGRLRRTGQVASTVFVHRLAMANTIETRLMLPRLRERGISQSEFQRAFERFKTDEIT